MSYQEVLRRIWDENHLFGVLVELTYQCNLNCLLCYNDPGLPGTPLSTAQYGRFFEDLKDMGVMNLTFSGGEPLAHPDFFALGARARALGFVVRLKTNGHALGGRLARRLKDEVDPFQVEVSLHGATAQTHDRQTRVPGSFDRLRQHLGEWRDLGFRVRLKTPLTAWNEHEIEAMAALADELGCRLDFDPQITPRDNGDPAPLLGAPSPQGVERLYRLLQDRAARDMAAADDQVVNPASHEPAGPEKKPARKQHCGAGSMGVTVDPVGNVYPCVQWRRRLGNLHHQSIKTIWVGSPELAEIRRLSAQVDDFVGGYGQQGRAMSFCPGLAEQTTGSVVRLYPSTALNLRILQRLNAGHSTLPAAQPPAAKADEPAQRP